MRVKALKATAKASKSTSIAARKAFRVTKAEGEASIAAILPAALRHPRGTGVRGRACHLVKLKVLLGRGVQD